MVTSCICRATNNTTSQLFEYFWNSPHKTIEIKFPRIGETIFFISFYHSLFQLSVEITLIMTFPSTDVLYILRQIFEYWDWNLNWKFLRNLLSSPPLLRGSLNRRFKTSYNYTSLSLTPPFINSTSLLFPHLIFPELLKTIM